MKEYRLYGDGRTDNTAALQELLDMKGTLVLLKGVYMTGPLTVHEDTRIEFEEGAVLKFIPDFSLYGPVYTRWEGVKCHCMHPCLYIDGARNVTITGKGTIDGSGQAWWDQANLRRNAADGPQTDIERMFASLNPGYEDQPGGGGGRQVQFLRPPLVQIHESSGVTIEGLTIVDSPFWTIHPVFSDRIVLRDLRIENPADAPNTDGIDIESCTDVVVESCFVHVGDDGIALKSGSGRSGIEDAAPTSRVAIRGCTVKAAHGGAVIGSETAAGIDHIEVSDCIFDGTDRGIRIKSRRGRGGSIHDLVFRNLTMNDNLCPLAVNMYYRCGCNDMSCFSLDPQPVTDETPSLYNLEITGCHGTGARASAAMIVGLPEMKVSNVKIRDCHFAVASQNLVPVSQSDMFLGLPEIDQRGIRLRFVENLELENVHVDGVEQEIVMED